MYRSLIIFKFFGFYEINECLFKKKFEEENMDDI